MTKSSHYEKHQQTDRSFLRKCTGTIISEMSESVRQCTNAESNDNGTMAQSTSIGTSSAPMYNMHTNVLDDKQKSVMQDAMYAIENHPTLAAGYVTACDIYVMQGAVLTAMEILKSGLRSVPPTEQALLYDRLAMIKKILGPRIDFMEKLPAEIVVNIFVRLEKDMVLINCTTVSKHWRYILLQQCPELWRTAIIGRPPFTSPATLVLPLVANNVQDLKLYTSDENILRTLVGMAADNQFPSITCLTVATGQLMLMLPFLRDTLTRLVIHLRSNHRGCPESPAEFSLNTVLSACPNLQDLSITSPNVVTYQRPQMLSIDSYLLKSLYIKAKHCQHTLQELIPHCPRLEKLYAINDFYSTILPSIEQHCPFVTHLVTIEQPLTNQFSITNMDNVPPGLHTLQYQVSNVLQSQAVTSIVTKNTSSLTTLELRVVNEQDFHEGLEQLANVDMNQMKVLGLSIWGNNAQYGEFAASRIQHCPSLEVLSIDLRYGIVPDQFFMVLAGHRHLHTLEISDIQSKTCGLEELLVHLSGLGSDCMLKNISIEFSNFITDGMLNILADVRTLEAVKILCPYPYNNLTTDGVATFVRKLKAMPHLKTLQIESMPYITDATICLLAEKNGLQTLALTFIEDITSNGVRAMADRLCPTLETVTVSGPLVDQNAQDYLQKSCLR
ncbi:hypothetical protein BJV82DRAFT_629727 [Fennellomyces sp. T-0311]|nr:hypothetical protein BJV82DRAFT_629727 [Fennellomyces sp. T-0311]